MPDLGGEEQCFPKWGRMFRGSNAPGVLWNALQRHGGPAAAMQRRCSCRPFQDVIGSVAAHG